MNPSGKDRDFYKVLGVTKTASQEEIKKSYRTLAKKYHPDANPYNARAEARFKEVSEAYDVIGSADSRKVYDNLQETGSNPENFESAEDIYADFYADATSTASGSAPPRPSTMGTDINHQITIPYSLADLGGKYKFTYKYNDGGSKTATVKIPPKFKSGKRLRLTGFGNPGLKGGVAGDLYLEISVEQPRRGENVEKSIEISNKEARDGCIKQLNFSRKKIPISFKLKIPAGTKDGTKIVARGRGIPGEYGNPNGDATIEIRVMPPKVGNDVNAYAVFTLANEFYLGDKSIPFRQFETNLELGRITTPEIRKAVAKGNLLVEPVTVHKPGLAPNQEHVDVPGDLYLTIYPSIGLARFVNFLFTGILGFVIYEIIQFLSHVLN